MAGGIWYYEVRAYSPSGEYYAGFRKALTNLEWSYETLRKEAERQAWEAIHHTEGVNPDTPIKTTGWYQPDAKETERFLSQFDWYNQLGKVWAEYQADHQQPTE